MNSMYKSVMCRTLLSMCAKDIGKVAREMSLEGVPVNIGIQAHLQGEVTIDDLL